MNFAVLFVVAGIFLLLGAGFATSPFRALTQREKAGGWLLFLLGALFISVGFGLGVSNG